MRFHIRFLSLTPDFLLVLFLFSACGVNADIGFKAARSYYSNANPNAIAVGDFNGDGKKDLVVSNNFGGSTTNNINVMLSNGDGTFGPAMGTTTNTIPSAVAVGDFNEDGKLDVVAADVSRGGVILLLGNGNGTFGSPALYLTGSYPVSIAVGDFNGDGHKDLAVAVVNTNSVSIFLGNGNGTLQLAVAYPAGSNPESVVAGDLNGDGKTDLIFANYSSWNVTVLLGDGTGAFSAPTSYFMTGGPYSVTVADLNGDGKLDVVAATKDGGQVSVLLGKGDGTFEPFIQYPAGAGPYSVSVADINGDSKPDLLVLNATANNLGVLLGNGNGTFQPVVFLPTGAPAMDAPTGKQIAIDDFDHDGKPDVAVVNEGLTISVLLGRGDGTFPAALNINTGAAPVSVTAADFDLNGKMDFAIANQGANSISVFLQNANGGFVNSFSYPVGPNPSSIASADFNGDGKPDLVVANKDANNISVLIGNGGGTFQTAVPYAVGSQPVAVVVADLNKDGKADLITANLSTGLPQGTVSILLGKGDGTFVQAVPQTVGNGPVSIAVADLDGDGKLDLAVANSLNNVMSILFGLGNGSFQNQQFTPTGTGVTSVVAADINDDLRADLVLGNFDGVKVLINNGNGTFQVPAIYPAAIGPLAVIAGDFDGDGKVDVLALGYSAALLLNNGDSALKPALFFGVGQSPLAVTLADFNDDGALDALVTNRDNNSATLLLNGMGTSLAVSSSSIVSAYHESVLVSANLQSIIGSSIKPTGTVAIRDGGIPIATLTPDSAGLANITINNLSVGSHNITAAYSGDSNFITRSSNSLTQIVNRASLGLALQVGPHPLIVGDSVSLAALLTPQFGGQPSGSIVFNDGATVFGTKPLNSLQETLSTAALGFGQHSISASYPGDENFLPALSPSLAEDVLTRLVISPLNWSFPSQILGRSARSATFTMSNRGSTPVVIGSITPSSSFAQLNNCGGYIAPLQSCSVDVTFSPVSVGNITGSIELADDAGGSPHSISLSGVGVDFQLSVTRPARSQRSGTPIPVVSEATIAIRGELSSPVTLGCSGTPPGMQCTVTPNQIIAANTTIPIEVKFTPIPLKDKIARIATPGVYTITLEARMGEIARSLPVQIAIPSQETTPKRSLRLSGRQ